jgi:soluble lytic murein transglycosylase-like protein
VRLRATVGLLSLWDGVGGHVQPRAAILGQAQTRPHALVRPCTIASDGLARALCNQSQLTRAIVFLRTNADKPSGTSRWACSVIRNLRRLNSVNVGPLAAYVTEASRRFGIPERWIRAIMRVESDDEQRARSKKGAMGLMQIMPGTWTELRSRYRLGVDPYDVRDNILAGAAYIRELSDRYGAPGFLAAYNAGPGRYERHLATGRPLPDETQAYVATLAPMITRARTTCSLVRSQDRLPGPTLHYSRRAPPASHRIVALRLTCARTAHHAPTALSTYRPSCPTLATCSCTRPAR